jgi:hypothetical protein
MATVYFAPSDMPYARNALFLAVDRFFERINVVEKGDLVAVKLHMGELGNTGYIRPIFVRRVVDFIKKQGGTPFLTDTTTLYGGHRSTAIDYLETAAIHGFSISSMGCPVVIADGVRGEDAEQVTVGKETIPVARGIFDADSLIVLSHFKGHGMAGFGGALKNLGMGCCSKEGKAWQHAASMPVHDPSACTLCLKCQSFCPVDAIGRDTGGGINIVYERCRGCGACTVLCDAGCFTIPSDNIAEFQRRLAVAAKAVFALFAEKSAFFNMLADITPRCDCCSFAGKPLVNDIGLLASRDPVAIDAASHVLVCEAAGTDVFENTHAIDGRAHVIEAERIGMGTQSFIIEEQ